MSNNHHFTDLTEDELLSLTREDLEKMSPGQVVLITNEAKTLCDSYDAVQPEIDVMWVHQILF